MTDVFDSIADDLAGPGYAVVDQFLSQKEVDDILSLHVFQEKTQFKKAGIGKQNNLQINEAIRGDHILWIEKTTAPAPVKIYLDRIAQLISHLNRALFLSLKDFEVHFTVYPVGTYYKRHIDQFKKDDHRKLSIICYLNKHWQPSHGGNLLLHLPGKIEDILPTAGRVVCFRSDQIEHEVLAATRERMSLTGWVLDQVSDLRYL
jgi:SM-20-related protein